MTRSELQLFELEVSRQYLRLNALPVEFRYVKKFLWWPRRNPVTNELMWLRVVWMREKTDVRWIQDWVELSYGPGGWHRVWVIDRSYDFSQPKPSAVPRPDLPPIPHRDRP